MIREMAYGGDWKSDGWFYKHIKDLQASLTTIDAKFVDLKVPTGQVFGKASAWLQREHDQNPSVSNGKDTHLPPGVAYIADDGKPVLTIEEVERREKSLWTWRLKNTKPTRRGMATGVHFRPMSDVS